MSMTLISRTTLTTTAASVTFNSIPQTFQTLKLVVSARTSGTNSTAVIKPNNNGSNYSGRRLYGTGSSAASDSLGSTAAYFGIITNSNQTASTFGSTEVTFPNYFGSTNKPISFDGVDENNATAATQIMVAGLWSDTPSITLLNVAPFDGSFVSGSTFSLYGVS